MGLRKDYRDEAKRIVEEAFPDIVVSLTPHPDMRTGNDGVVISIPFGEADSEYLNPSQSITIQMVVTFYKDGASIDELDDYDAFIEPMIKSAVFQSCMYSGFEYMAEQEAIRYSFVLKLMT